ARSERGALLTRRAGRNVRFNGSMGVIVEGAQGKGSQHLGAGMSFGDQHQPSPGKGERGSLHYEKCMARPILSRIGGRFQKKVLVLGNRGTRSFGRAPGGENLKGKSWLVVFFFSGSPLPQGRRGARSAVQSRRPSSSWRRRRSTRDLAL